MAAAHEAERQQYLEAIKNGIENEDDPLALYVQYIQWINKTFPDNEPNSGLMATLKEATNAFRADSSYRGDLRYLKIWVLYARHLDPAETINLYANLAKQHIGTSYSLLYEEYARALEKVGRTADAEHVYKMGLKRKCRPLDRLKARYKDFKYRIDPDQGTPDFADPHRTPTGADFVSTKPASTASAVSPLASSAKASPNFSSPSSSSPSNAQHSTPRSASTRESRYALMLQPAQSKGRPEKLQCNMSLLFTPDHVEYSASEARARTLGLLGKKWAPLPITSLAQPAHTSSSVRVNFDDSQRPNTGKYGARRKSLLTGEPTVTINTKEALADVFGMYNSPDKTVKTKIGGKHAPIRKIESLTSSTSSRQDAERSGLGQSQSGGFKIFMEEEQAPPQKENKPTPKFLPFVDSESDSSAPPPAKTLLGPAFAPTTPATKGERPSENALPVFTPASKTPLRDVHTEAYGKPSVRPMLHERAKSAQDISTYEEPRPTPKFKPFVDSENQQTPFKVFSRPAEENPFTPKFTPSAPPKPKPTFTPYREEDDTQGKDELKPEQVPPLQYRPSPLQQVAAQRIPPPSPATSTDSYADSSGSAHSFHGMAEQDEDDYSSSFAEDEDEQPLVDVADPDYETPSDEAEGPYADYEEELNAHHTPDAPLGGRFGQFNVMTPISERTLEYTSTRSVFATPTHLRTQDTVAEEDEYEDEYVGNILDREGLGGGGDDTEEAWHPAQGGQPWKNISQYQDDTTEPLHGRTGGLGDALATRGRFHPPNPCNPFEPSIISTLLSLVIPDHPDIHFYDLHNEEAHMLDDLQKLAKKTRKASGGSASAPLDFGSDHPLVLGDQRFKIRGKLGEGGFGAVFLANIDDEKDEDDTDIMFDDEDEDEEGVKSVAIKIIRPRNLWEYHVLRKLHAGLPPRLSRSVVAPEALYAYHDESFLVLEYCPQGTLLDVVTSAVSAGVSQPGGCLDELLVMFFAIELVRLIEGMHSAGFIHGDLKIDNCLVRLEDVAGGSSAWGNQYEPSGEHGWAHKGVKLIDFGRTIYMPLFPSEQEFIADWQTGEQDCFEIREQRPWTYQTDYFGLAGIVYCLLFGKYITPNAILEDGETHRIATPLKRYWQTDIWSEFFDVCLNPVHAGGGKLPISEGIAQVRGRMEAWLVANCNRSSGTLKGLLKKVEVSCLR
ncbi:hypothetical protein CYLTODRAFT_491961 [Cylindrobasidium torrendii FP15055 ss-10]|uniref:Kinase-like protein n=1 Tax=Cylindrobasidium torrendii FP15055 ss-10 TaxID=1314674 RepID=A0A0D7B6P9_9AGAR|nr:hypothetical protein CYLTODRAFT_491961 [Cylindrobasidium torrendii FP15055 ss-10]